MDCNVCQLLLCWALEYFRRALFHGSESGDRLSPVASPSKVRELGFALFNSCFLSAGRMMLYAFSLLCLKSSAPSEWFLTLSSPPHPPHSPLLSSPSSSSDDTEPFVVLPFLPPLLRRHRPPGLAWKSMLCNNLESRGAITRKAKYVASKEPP